MPPPLLCSMLGVTMSIEVATPDNSSAAVLLPRTYPRLTQQNNIVLLQSRGLPIALVYPRIFCLFGVKHCRDSNQKSRLV